MTHVLDKPSRPRPRVWFVYLAVIAGLTSAYILGHFVGLRWLNSGPVYNIIGASTVVALIVGARKNSADRRLPWYLFALGQAFFVTGDVLAYNYHRFFGGELPSPSIADPFYLAFYPLLVAGLLLLIRERNETRDRASLIDALIVTVAAAALSWVYLMAPYAHDHTLKLTTKLTSIAYPMMDILVLGVVLRLAVGSRRRGVAFRFLVVGTGALLLTDAIYGWKLLHGGYTTGGVLDIGWAVFYALLGAAALHPSMRELVERAPEPDDRLTRHRLVLLTCATLAAPAVLMARGLLGESLDGYVLVAASMILFGLVLTRMTGLVHKHEEAVRREAALRLGGEALVTAITREEIYSAALQAARSVVDEDVVARLYIANGTPAQLIAVGSSDGDAASLPPLCLDELPATVNKGLGQHHIVSVEQSGQFVALAPLFIREEVTGLLSVVSSTRLKRAAEESLATLATEVALTLQSAALTEQALYQRSEARLSSLVENASDVICIVGEDSAFRYVSPSVQRRFGHLPEELSNLPLTDIVHPDEQQRVFSFIAACAAQPAGTPQTAEFRVRQSAGHWRDVEALGTNLLGHEAVDGIVLNIRDVTERNELNHRAFHDPLTNLPNRLLFRNRLEHALAGQLRDKRLVAVLYLDIDNFKDVNDSLGHAAGDKVLQEVGRRLDECMRPVDTAARLGGDEFAVLVHGSESETHTIEIAHRVRNALAVTVPIEGEQISIATSIGIAFSDQAGPVRRDAAGLLRDADAAMYMAKQSESGKGGYAVFQSEMHAQALSRLELKADLQRALEDGEFTLRYQPIIDLPRGDMAGMEALARWEHPTRGTVSPLEFIPLVEETGLIVPLGHQILREACKHAALLQHECPRDPPLSMSVNVSAFQLQRPEFVDEVRRVLEESELAPSSLILEVTESVMMRDMDLSISRMNELRSLGVKLAIDDFGTGYSSLMYLRRLPVDILKIDRSFMADPSPKVTELTAAVVQLARIFELDAVVEGIETATHLERIQEMHSDFGQGFYFAKPLSGEDVMTIAVEQSQIRTANGLTPLAWVPASE
jgi:diguanylate cyclase (GGDEF)-like protein/PAS domain S-box-containing protein